MLPPRLKLGEAVELFASSYSNPPQPREVLESSASSLPARPAGDLAVSPYSAERWRAVPRSGDLQRAGYTEVTRD